MNYGYTNWDEPPGNCRGSAVCKKTRSFHNRLIHTRARKLLCGRPSFASVLKTFSGIANELQSYVRPLRAVHVTAGHDGVRRSDPNRLFAL